MCCSVNSVVSWIKIGPLEHLLVLPVTVVGDRTKLNLHVLKGNQKGSPVHTHTNMSFRQLLFSNLPFQIYLQYCKTCTLTDSFRLLSFHTEDSVNCSCTRKHSEIVNSIFLCSMLSVIIAKDCIIEVLPVILGQPWNRRMLILGQNCNMASTASSVKLLQALMWSSWNVVGLFIQICTPLPLYVSLNWVCKNYLVYKYIDSTLCCAHLFQHFKHIQQLLKNNAPWYWRNEKYLSTCFEMSFFLSFAPENLNTQM